MNTHEKLSPLRFQSNLASICMPIFMIASEQEKLIDPNLLTPDAHRDEKQFITFLWVARDAVVTEIYLYFSLTRD